MTHIFSIILSRLPATEQNRLLNGPSPTEHPWRCGTISLINNLSLFSFCLWLVVVHHHIYDPTHKDLRSEHQTISIAEQFRDFRTPTSLLVYKVLLMTSSTQSVESLNIANASWLTFLTTSYNVGHLGLFVNVPE